MKSFFKGWLALVIMFTAVSGQAQTVSGLYQARVPAGAALAEPSAQQLVEGLEGVLVKLTGTRDLAANPALARVLRQAPQLLEDAQLKQSSWLLSYRPATLNALLMQAGVKRIAAQRPRLLVWLGDKDEAGTQALANRTHPAWAVMKQTAQARGLPMVQPQPGLSSLAPGPLWQFENRVIRAASKPYEADAILVGVPVKGRMNWQLLAGDKSYSFADTAATTQAYRAVLNRAADLALPLAGEAHFSFQRQGRQLAVNGVFDLYDLNGLLATLRASEQITSVALARVTGSRVYLYVRPAAGADLDQLLPDLPGLSTGPSVSANVLNLQWVRPQPQEPELKALPADEESLQNSQKTEQEITDV